MKQIITGTAKKKSLGQVFLKVDWPAKLVARLLKDWNISHVLEIGPGEGVLTRSLLTTGLHVTAVEKDDRFASDLHRNTGALGTETASRLVVTNEDILKYDLAAWVEQSHPRSAVVGNIPYNISTPILRLLLPHMDRLIGVILMTQDEFARRLLAEPNCKDYGSLSVFAQLRSAMKLESKVERSCFSPVPRVDSAILSLVPLKNRLAPDELTKVESLTRSAFSQRRKKLRNSIKSVVSNLDETGSPVDLSRRADSLTPDEFVSLARFALKDD